MYGRPLFIIFCDLFPLAFAAEAVDTCNLSEPVAFFFQKDKQLSTTKEAALSTRLYKEVTATFFSCKSDTDLGFRAVNIFSLLSDYLVMVQEMIVSISSQLK